MLPVQAARFVPSTRRFSRQARWYLFFMGSPQRPRSVLTFFSVASSAGNTSGPFAVSLSTLLHRSLICFEESVSRFPFRPIQS